MAVTAGKGSRVWIIIFEALIIAVGFPCVIYQLWKLCISDYSDELRTGANQQQMNSTIIPAKRGNIYDRNGNTLAQSATVWNVVISPNAIHQADDNLKEGDTPMAQKVATHLSNILDGVTYSDVLKLTEDSTRYYEIVKKRITRPVLEEILEAEKAYSLKGIDFEESTRRFYPYGSFASTVIGFCNDEGGAYGIEAYYNKRLAGTPGRVLSARNAVGNEMDNNYKEHIPAEDGQSLVLTIDEVVQHYLEKALDTALIAHNPAKRISGIVMDVNTGEILAMATKEDFDPNSFNEVNNVKALERLEGLSGEEYEEQLSKERFNQWRNKAVSDPYEPGSVFKLVTLASAIESGHAKDTDSFYCNGVLEVANRSIHCWKTSGHGQETLTDILVNSCNPGFMTLGQRMGAETFSKYFEAFGLTEKTGIDIPGEADSIYHRVDKMGIVELSSSSFGQTFKVTPIQMITADVATINGGYLLKPFVVKQVLDAQGNVVESYDRTVRRQVISNETSKMVASMAEKVVSEGSGNGAYVAGYRVGGKTGTSQKLDQLDEYGQVTDHVLSFFGFAPADDPKVAVLVLIDEPELKSAYGSVIAAPVVGAIMSDILPYMDIEPKYTEEELEKREIYVKDVVGQKPHEAQSIMANAGLQGRLMGNGAEVIRQVPSAGAPVPKGSTVILYTDQETETPMMEVPDVVGCSGTEANKRIVSSRLNLRIVGADIDAEGTVAVSQSVEPGEMLEMGSVITVNFINQNAAEDLTNSDEPVVPTE